MMISIDLSATFLPAAPRSKSGSNTRADLGIRPAARGLFRLYRRLRMRIFQVGALSPPTHDNGSDNDLWSRRVAFNLAKPEGGGRYWRILVSDCSTSLLLLSRNGDERVLDCGCPLSQTSPGLGMVVNEFHTPAVT